MRLLAATAIAATALSMSACSSSDDNSSKDPDGSTTAATSTAEKSVRKDVEAYAVQLEQAFSTGGYPKNTAGAVGVAMGLDLKLSPGNTIASYVYDRETIEFKLCVENTSGAWAVYDTRPMTVLKSGSSGGCP